MPMSNTFFLYNTICSVAIYDEREDIEVILNEVKVLAHEIRKMLDFYDPESELGKLNREHRAGVPEKVSKELYTFIASLLKFSEESEGFFDPSLGPVVKAWDIPARKPRVPAKQEIEKARKQTGASFISCNEQESTVTFWKPGMVLDAGGAGKGYAVWKAVGYLKNRGVKNAAVNFEGTFSCWAKRLRRTVQQDHGK